MRVSRRKRPGVCAAASRITLSATGPPESRSVASYTRPIPPSPARRTSSKRPSMMSAADISRRSIEAFAAGVEGQRQRGRPAPESGASDSAPQSSGGPPRLAAAPPCGLRARNTAPERARPTRRRWILSDSRPENPQRPCPMATELPRSQPSFREGDPASTRATQLPRGQPSFREGNPASARTTQLPRGRPSLRESHRASATAIELVRSQPSFREGDRAGAIATELPRGRSSWREGNRASARASDLARGRATLREGERPCATASDLARGQATLRDGKRPCARATELARGRASLREKDRACGFPSEHARGGAKLPLGERSSQPAGALRERHPNRDRN